MLEQNVHRRKSWCIVVADDHGPEYVPAMAGAARTAPVQYCGFGEPTTLLQRALHRAKQIAPIGQILVTVREENRERWEPALWFIRPEHRFVSDDRRAAPLATAAALSAIASDSVSNVVTILPARCYVANEWVLCAALEQLQAALPRIPEGVGTLGMIDIDEGPDEDYLVPFEGQVGPGLAVRAVARQPAGWVARHLKEHGAMVASGMMSGPVRGFAMHAFKHRPGLSEALSKMLGVSAIGERVVSANRFYELPRNLMRPVSWWPPTFPQRAIRVHRCGFRGLKTARAVVKVSASCPATIDAIQQPVAGPGVQLMAAAAIATHEGGRLPVAYYSAPSIQET
jgi:mannose-1-phosphate guanylyltransferase